MNSQFPRWVEPGRYITLDEGIFHTGGRCSLYSYTPGKPGTGRGLKCWFACLENGYVYRFMLHDPLQNATTELFSKSLKAVELSQSTRFLLGESVLLEMCRNFAPGTIVNADRLFITIRNVR